MDRLSRMRAPLAAAALVALTLVALARVVLGLSEAFSAGGSAAVAAARLAPNGGDGALTVLVGVLVAGCWLEPAVAARRRLAAWGAVLTAVSLLASLVALGLASAEVAGWRAVWIVPDLAVPALVGVGLVALARAPLASVPLAVEPDPAEATALPAPTPDPELAPAWPEDTATGAVWRTAGEAAQGAPALGWGSADDAVWSLPALPPAPSEPDRDR